jgi:hypothetical protein
VFYVMVVTDGVATRFGRMYRDARKAVNLATKRGGYVEAYGKGLYWPLDPDALRKVMV